MRLGVFLTEYFLTSGLRDSTQSNYSTTVSVFESWAGRPVDLGEIDDLMLSRWLADYEKTVKPHTAKSKRRTMISILNAAFDAGLIASKPVRVRKIKAPETEKDAWSSEEVQRLIRACDSLSGRFRNTCILKQYYFQGIFMTAWDTGLRLADLVQIETEWIVNSPTFSITTNKTGRRRIVRVNDETRRIALISLDRFAKGRKYIWEPWRNGSEKNQTRGVSVVASQIVASAGLDCSDGPFKKLRRSSITEAERLSPGTGWIQGGHAGPDVTIKHYINQSKAYSGRPIPSGLTG